MASQCRQTSFFDCFLKLFDDHVNVASHLFVRIFFLIFYSFFLLLTFLIVVCVLVFRDFLMWSHRDIHPKWSVIICRWVFFFGYRHFNHLHLWINIIITAFMWVYTNRLALNPRAKFSKKAYNAVISMTIIYWKMIRIRRHFSCVYSQSEYFPLSILWWLAFAWYEVVSFIQCICTLHIV